VKIIFSILLGLMLVNTAFGKTPKSAFDIMTFEDSFECNDKFPHHSFCESVEFKAWNDDEKALVGNYLKNLNDPRLRFFLKTLQKNGITKIHRVKYSSSWYTSVAERKVKFVRATDKAILWVNPVTHVIGFTDSFFSSSEFMDPYARMPRKQLNVLHELSHVFDISLGHLSSNKEFSEAAGWYWNVKSEEFEIKGFPSLQTKSEFQSVLDFIKNDKTPAAYERDRVQGVLHGFPTVYSMLNSHECFAELLTYYILDPTAPVYLSKDVMSYFDKILSGKIPPKPQQ
jgi:hypothetical protein